MRTLRISWSMVALAAVVPGQTKPAQKPAPVPAATHSGTTIKYDSNGWPILPADATVGTPPPAPAVETSRTKAPTSARGNEAPEPPAGKPVTGSGMQMDSPLLDVFQATHTPAEFKRIGSVSIWWRLTIYGEQGEVIGLREVTQIADCAYAERDRLEYADGRVYGRIGASVFAERGGMPFPTLAAEAEMELKLFGLQWRLPWCFGDAAAYAVVANDTVVREDRKLLRIMLERRPPPEFDIAGPELDPKPRDHFELVYEPGSGTPTEFVHRFAANRQTRRMLLEDWQDYQGVRYAKRRVYVDEAQRQTTALEILRIEPVHTSERDFRLR